MTTKTKLKPCKWRDGWPKSPGVYLVLLRCRDKLAITVEPYESDTLGKCLDYSDGMEGVACKPKDESDLIQTWGEAKSSFGPIPFDD